MEKSEPFTITTIITFDDQNEPQAVTVENFGGMPRSAVRAICEEALDREFGGNHDYRVQLSPTEQFESLDDVAVFEVYKRFHPVFRKKS
jgi:hypothetical protein